MADVDAVVFDLDHTLCVHETDPAEIHAEVVDRVEIEPFFEPAEMWGVDVEDVPPVDSEREYFEHVYRTLAESAGEDPALAEPLAAATAETIDHSAVSLRDGAEAALERAAEVGPVGLVTNGSEEGQRTKLEALGVADAFDVEVYCGPTTDLPAKPDPAPLEHALDELGVDPGRALKVGDALRWDVAGAHEAGMMAAWVPVEDPESDPDPTPEYTLDSMRELAELL